MRKGFNTTASKQNKSKDENSGWNAREIKTCRPFAYWSKSLKTKNFTDRD